MNVLVVGSGGREHALAWKIAQSSLVDKIYCAPGNAGISQIAECPDISPTDIFALRNFAYQNKIDLTVVGPEASLVAGIVDKFQEDGLRIFGPNQQSAQLEGSKSFCKELLKKNGIPTAGFHLLKTLKQAQSFLKETNYPVVLKADGLAAGKGVSICETSEEAHRWITEVMEKRTLGEAGASVVAEELLMGEEISVLAITDGQTLLVLETAQDHKRAFDGDRGPNTGGMGAYSPVPFVTSQMTEEIISQILLPTLHGLKKAGCYYQGVLYAGLILTQSGPKVLEYNIRFGDPETQPLMVRLKSDLVPILLGAVTQSLDKVSPPEWYPDSAVCVVLASGGYPGKYQTGHIINGLAEAGKTKNIQVFHAGTGWKNKQIVATGGRVLGVTARGPDITQARELAYQTIKNISFENAFYRHDISRLRKPG